VQWTNVTACSESDDWSMAIMHCCECSEFLNVPNHSRNILVIILVILEIENERYSSGKIDAFLCLVIGDVTVFD